MAEQEITSTIRVMTPAEVAAVFGVDPKTVARWAKSGRLSFIRTPGGHRRFLRSEVETLASVIARIDA